MKSIYLLSICDKNVKIEDYRVGWENERDEVKKVFCGDSWIETLEKTIKDLGNSFSDYIKGQGKEIEELEKSELIALISEYDLKNGVLTTAFQSKEEAEKDLKLKKEEIAKDYEDYTLKSSNSTCDIYIHNDFLNITFNGVTFEPNRGYGNFIRCYDENGKEIGTISDPAWEVWFNKIKTINSETFKEIISMTEKPGPCFGD